MRAWNERTTDEPKCVGLALGANTGPREVTLKRAVLALRPWVANIRIASLYSGQAVDRAGFATSTTDRYLNTTLVGDI